MAVVLISIVVCYIDRGDLSTFFTPNILSEKFDRLQRYSEQVKSYDNIEIDYKLASQQISGIQSKINGTVDIMPYDISLQ